MIKCIKSWFKTFYSKQKTESTEGQITSFSKELVKNTYLHKPV